MNFVQLLEIADEHFVDLRRIATNDEKTHKYLKSGYLKRVGSAFAVYYPVLKKLAPHERAMLELIACGRGLSSGIFVLSAAARIHGLWTLNSSRSPEVTTMSAALPGRSRWGAKQYFRIPLRQEHWINLGGFRVTTKERTCIDVARYYGFVEGLVAMDSYLAQGGRERRIKEVLDWLSKLKGLKVARECLDHASAYSESPWESAARAHIVQARLGVPIELQKQIMGYRADICLDGWLIVEIDGDAKYRGGYGAPEEVIARERQREKELTNAGYRVLRYSPRQIKQDPEGMIAAIRRELNMGPRVAL